MHTSPPLLSSFPKLLLCFATALCCCLLLGAIGPSLAAAEKAEQLFTDDQWAKASERSAIAAPGSDSRSENQGGGQVQGSMLRMVAGLIVVIAFAVLIAWLVRRSGLHRRLPGQRGDHLEVIESLNLGPKRGVSLLRVGEQFVLVGHNEQSMAALGTFDGLGAGNNPPAAPSLTQPAPSPTSLESPAPQAMAVREGDRNEASQAVAAGETASAKTAADSVDDFRRRLNRLLGGRS
jgi:flagellar biosynthetic protein FliO